MLGNVSPLFAIRTERKIVVPNVCLPSIALEIFVTINHEKRLTVPAASERQVPAVRTEDNLAVRVRIIELLAALFHHENTAYDSLAHSVRESLAVGAKDRAFNTAGELF